MHEAQTRTDPPSARGDEEIKAGLIGSVQSREHAIVRARQRFARPLAAFIRERVAPTLDSDEIATAVNETFCALARYAAEGKFCSSGALSTLLFTIAQRRATDLLRKKTCKKRRTDEDSGLSAVVGETELTGDDFSDDEFATQVTQRLIRAPEINELWRTAAHEAQANEIIRRFRLWVGTLSCLQRKVAECMLTHFGSATDAEMSAEIIRGGLQVTPASVKSARSEIVRKFKSLIDKKERNEHS